MIYLLFFIFTLSLVGREPVERHDTIHLYEGNLALRTAQQPAPLYSFGHFLVDKGNIQGFLAPNWLFGPQKYVFSLTPQLKYGFTNNSALLVGLPAALKAKDTTTSMSGLGDLFWLLESAFHTKDTLNYIDAITLLVGSTFPTGKPNKSPVISPTGSPNRNPGLGFGAPSMFFGLTAHRRSIDWYYWLNTGATYIAPYQGTRTGSNFIYQVGVGRKIYAVSQKMIVTGMLEFLGLYTENDTLCKAKDPASGSNIISIAPVFWFSTMHFLLKAGVSIPVIQQVNNKADKNIYTATIVAGFTFN